jgi:hypothetical protein
VPIRTNRGRAAVYRKLWGWPMRSPKHLAMTAVIAALLLTGLGIVIPKLAGKDGLPASASTSTSARPGSATTYLGQPPQPGATSVPTSLPTRLPTPTQQPSSAPAAPQALETATAWAQAWVFHPAGTTNERWLDRLRPHTTEEYIGVMATVDPANVPANAVTGPAVAKLSFERSVEVEVPTDNGTLRITVIKTDNGWKVANYERGA